MSKKMLKVSDVAEVFGCSLKKAYQIVGQEDFPKITIGRIYYVPEEEFDKWIKRYTGKTYTLY